MASPAQVKFTQKGWSDEASRRLIEVDAHDNNDVREFRQGVHTGDFHLMEITVENTPVGVMIYSVNNTPSHSRSMIIHAVQADAHDGVDMVAEVRNYCHMLAAKMGCADLVIWTDREGFKRKLRKYGMTPHYVFTEQVKHEPL